MAVQLKLSGQLAVGLKGERGLAYHEVAYAVRPETIAAKFEAVPGAVPLEPGQEAEVTVPLHEFPANANVQTIRATLTVVADAAGTQPDRTTVVVQTNNQTPQTYRLQAGTPGELRNVEVKLAQGEVFWSHAGTLPPRSYDLPDFAAQLNAYLDKVKAQNGQIVLRFVVKSDTAGRVLVAVTPGSLTYALLQTQSWPNPLDETIRLDRNLQLDFGTLASLPLDPITGPGGRQFALARLTMDIGGTFGPERLLGEVGTPDGREFATISTDYALAQRLQCDTPVRLVGLLGFCKVDAAAELYLELQPDVQGGPATATPLAKTTLSLAPVEPVGTLQQLRASFEAPLALQAHVPYWVVLKGIRGKVLLALQASPGGYLQHVLINRGGQLWKRLSRTAPSTSAALLWLVYLPEADHQTAAVEIGIAGTPQRQRVDPTSAVQTLAFDMQGLDIQQAVIEVRSQARGTLSLANVMQEYEAV